MAAVTVAPDPSHSMRVGSVHPPQKSSRSGARASSLISAAAVMRFRESAQKVVTVHEKRDWTVVFEGYEHVRSKLPMLDRIPTLAKAANDAAVKVDALLRRGGSAEAWAPTSPDVPVQGELRDDQHRASHLRRIQIHLAHRVLPEPETGDLVGHRVHARSRVTIADSQQDQQSSVDAGDLPLTHPHLGSPNPLHDCPHHGGLYAAQ